MSNWECDVTTLENFLDGIPPERRRIIEKRGQHLIAENQSWRNLRLAAQRARSDLAKSRGLTGEEALDFQKETDEFLEAFAKHAKSIGANVRLTADFADSPSVTFETFDHFDDELTDAEQIERSLNPADKPAKAA